MVIEKENKLPFSQMKQIVFTDQQFLEGNLIFEQPGSRRYFVLSGNPQKRLDFNINEPRKTNCHFRRYIHSTCDKWCLLFPSRGKKSHAP